MRVEEGGEGVDAVREGWETEDGVREGGTGGASR